jgi:RND family efflux transporter MFP subunit
MKRALRRLVPAVILLVGVLALGALAGLRSGADRDRPQAAAPAVHVVRVEATSVPALVRTTGVVRPARQVDVSAEVGGRVIWQSDEMQPGGRFKKGEVMARIDPRDFEMGLQQEKSRVDQARLELETEEARRRIAKKEWEMLGKDPNSEDATLALRGPHLDTAKSALESAKSGVERSRLQLERTNLRAPFAAFVNEESIEVGQVVQPGARLATLIGADELWVTVSLPVESLGVIQLESPGQEGSSATVVQRLSGGTEVLRLGHVKRLASSLDAATRTATLLVTVPQPFDAQPGALPLLPGAFVDVHIKGRALDGVFPVPRSAVSDGDRVWVVEAGNKLARRTLEIAWRDKDAVYASGGLTSQDRVVTTPLAVPMEGMSVEITEEKASAALVQAPALTKASLEAGGTSP